MWPFVLAAALLGIVLMLALSNRGKQPAQLPGAKGEKNPFGAAVAALAIEPSAESYMKVVGMVVTHPAYDPYGRDIDSLIELYEAERHADAERKLRELMPTWVLTPSLHKIAFLLAKHRGDQAAGMVEMRLVQATIDGLLATGDGSREKPYVVVRIRDEYELLEHLEKKPAGQSLIRDGDRQLDCFELADGSEIYFDVSLPKSHLDRMLARAAEAS
jgi:hypothetical protein